MSAKGKKYYRDHHEEQLARHREYRETHKSEEAAWRFEHREELLASKAEYYIENKDRLLALGKKYRAEHPEIRCACEQRRRARKAKSPVNDFTAAQWKQLKDDNGNRCAYCGKVFRSLAQEHMTPLSRGGPHTLSNIVPACQHCNSDKWTATLEEYYRPLWIDRNYEGNYIS